MFAGMLVGKYIGTFTLRALLDIWTFQEANAYNDDYIFRSDPERTAAPR